MFVAHTMCSKPYYVRQKVLEIISQKKPASSDAVFLMGKMVSRAGVEACSRIKVSEARSRTRVKIPYQAPDPVSGSRRNVSFPKSYFKKKSLRCAGHAQGRDGQGVS